MNKTLIAALAAGLLIATAHSAVSQDVSAPAPAATAPSTGHIPAAPAGKAQVVFFRTGAYAGAATWFKIRENEAELGKLSNQSYFVAVLEPGTHTFTSATENKTHLKMELDAGETYYVRGSLQMGVLLYEVNLAPADQALFEKHSDHMHLVKFQGADTQK
jgi:hypothetical protein